MRPIILSALGTVAALSLIGIGYSLDELTNSVRDVHEHWWSTAPVLTLAASAAGLTWLLRRRPA